MAIPITPRKTISKTFLFIRSPQISSISSLNRRLILLKSSKSPLLENSSNDLHIIHIPSKTTEPLASDLQITNEFIRGLCKNPGTESLAFEYYQKAKRQPEFAPRPQTLKLLFRKLLKSKKWSSIAAVVQDLDTYGVFLDRLTYARLVGCCIKARKLKLAESVLRSMEAKNGEAATDAFSAAMRSYNKLHMYRSTVTVFSRMRNIGVLLSPWCYFFAMDAYSNLGNNESVLVLFREFESDKCDAADVCARIYSVLCDSLGKSGRAFEALRYFREMENKGIPPRSHMYASLISSFAAIREAEIAKDIFDEAREKRMVKDPEVFLKLVLMYVDIGDIEKTIAIVEAMVEIEVRVTDCILSSVINGYVKRRGLRTSVKAYEQLISLGCDPGQVTYASMIHVYCRLGAFRKAEALFFEMMEKGFDKCVVAYSTMISMYGKVGKAKNATRLLAKMKERGCKPNVWVYNSLIDMHGRQMDTRQVEKLWKEMRRQKIVPDKVSYTSIISAYSKARELKGCLSFYQEYRMNGGKLDRTLAAIMVGVFSKSSRIDELLKLLQEMKSEDIEADERLYQSALNALRDAALHAQVEWLRNNFSFEKDET